MIEKISFDNGNETRYVYYNTNTDCVYVGHQDPEMKKYHDFVAFTRTEWERIAQYFAKLNTT
jgi:hypothetical protein